MKWRVLFRPEVETDVNQAAKWYDSQQPGLALAFREEIIQLFDQLAENPRLQGR